MRHVVAKCEPRVMIARRIGNRWAYVNRGAFLVAIVLPQTDPELTHCIVNRREERPLYPHGIIEAWLLGWRHIEIINDVDAADKRSVSINRHQLAMQSPQA